MAVQGEDLVTLYDKAPLNARYWIERRARGHHQHL